MATVKVTEKLKAPETRGPRAFPAPEMPKYSYAVVVKSPWPSIVPPESLVYRGQGDGPTAFSFPEARCYPCDPAAYTVRSLEPGERITVDSDGKVHASLNPAQPAEPPGLYCTGAEMPGDAIGRIEEHNSEVQDLDGLYVTKRNINGTYAIVYLDHPDGGWDHPNLIQKVRLLQPGESITLEVP